MSKKKQKECGNQECIECKGGGSRMPKKKKKKR